MKIRFAFLLLVVGLVATVSSCSNRSLSVLNPCTINGVVQNVPVNPQRALDLLIVIDDSLSMQEEQAKLQEQVPRLVRLLLTGGVDEDMSTPVGEFPAIESLHVGVITPDLGHSTDPPHAYTASDVISMSVANVDFQPTPQCMRDGGNGKAGTMQVQGFTVPDRNPCDALTPSEGTQYMDYFPGAGFTLEQFVNDVQCVTGQGAPPADWGCGFEQQLESILAADRNGANEGFSREDALLAVILITDEDDCSTTDPRVFDIYDRDRTPDDLKGPFIAAGDPRVQFNLRCWQHSSFLRDVQDYVDGIAALKSDPSQVVFAAITGIPEENDLNCDAANTEAERYACILDEQQTPAMREAPNPPQDGEWDQQLTPACDAGAAGVAYPARRIVETMKGLAEANTGVGTVVESICADDYAPALEAIVSRIAAALRQLCLPRPLNRDSANTVGCEVREVQPANVECDEALGRVMIGTEDVGSSSEPDERNVCRITQLPSDGVNVPQGLGWFYDDFTDGTLEACAFNPTSQRVSFTEGAQPLSGARVRFECLQAAPPQTPDIGWPCTSSDSCVTVDCATSADPAACMEEALRERYDRDNLELVCDADSNTCQLTCENNAECPGGFVCFNPSGNDNFYCVNPTCELN